MMKDCDYCPSAPQDAETTFALIGQPNVGKSTIFNMLTGLNQHVGNWPGKTIECKTGNLNLEGSLIHLVDLPGTYSLTANSEEERITREYIIHEKPDVVIAIINAAMLERNLYLVTELLALDVPIVLGLNMMDVATKQGFKIDLELLQTALKIPVIPVIAAKNQGLKELILAALELSKNPANFTPTMPEIRPNHLPVYEQMLSVVKGHIAPPYNENWVAIKLLEGDKEVIRMMKTEQPELWPLIEEIIIAHEDAILDIAGGRYEWIERIVRAALLRPRSGSVFITDRLDRVATHPLWGFLLLVAVFGLVFWLTYALANPLVDLLNQGLMEPVSRLMQGWLVNAPGWLSAMVVDGLIGGVGTVLTFLPILVLFFLVIAILEDIGYLARAAFVMDRYLHWMGLHGRSFLPLFLGVGCNVPAVAGTRIIEDRRARLLTILLVPFVPCTARLAVITFITPIFFGEHSALVTWFLVTVNLSILLLVGIFLHRIILRGKQSPFVMEMPLYHLPNIRTISLDVWLNLVAFIKKAGTIIVVFSMIIWALSWLPSGDLESSLLAGLGRFLEPLGRLMGFNDWRLMVSLFSSFIAKENTIASLGVLFGAGETGLNFSANLSQVMSPAAGLAFLVVQMLFIPCVATVAAIKQETASWKWMTVSVLLMLVISLTAGVSVYRLALVLGL